jgi:hypothetical protein
MSEFEPIAEYERALKIRAANREIFELLYSAESRARLERYEAARVAAGVAPIGAEMAQDGRQRRGAAA